MSPAPPAAAANSDGSAGDVVSPRVRRSPASVRQTCPIYGVAAMSMSMAEAADEDDILELAAEAVSTLTGCSVEGIYIATASGAAP